MAGERSECYQKVAKEVTYLHHLIAYITDDFHNQQVMHPEPELLHSPRLREAYTRLLEIADGRKDDDRQDAYQGYRQFFSITLAEDFNRKLEKILIHDILDTYSDCMCGK